MFKVAVSACLLLSGLATAKSNVYLYPQLGPSSNGQLAVSRHLGLEFFDSVASLAPELNSAGSFVGQGPKHGLLLSLSEEDAQAVLPETLKSSGITLAGTNNFVFNYIQRAQHAYSHAFTESSYTPQASRILDVVSAPQEFLQELASLSAFLDSDASDDKFGAFQLTGLSQITDKASGDYKVAAAALRAAIQSAMAPASNINLAVVTFPSARHLGKRQPPTQSPLPIPAPQEPISSVSTCFTSADVCGNATSVMREGESSGPCSGRGQCVEASKVGRTCFVCACATTSSGKGQREDWVGTKCERKDISESFVLLTGTGIAMILLVVGSISLLYSVGDIPLPSTLLVAAPVGRKD